MVAGCSYINRFLGQRTRHRLSRIATESFKAGSRFRSAVIRLTGSSAPARGRNVNVSASEPSRRIDWSIVVMFRTRHMSAIVSLPCRCGAAGLRMTISTSRPIAMSKRRSRSTEYSRKLPRRSLETSGWDNPISFAASTWVIRRRRTIWSILLTRSALSRCSSAFGRPRSANTLPQPCSTITLSTCTPLFLAILVPVMLLCRFQPSLHNIYLPPRRCNALRGLLLERVQNIDGSLKSNSIDSAIRIAIMPRNYFQYA